DVRIGDPLIAVTVGQGAGRELRVADCDGAQPNDVGRGHLTGRVAVTATGRRGGDAFLVDYEHEGQDELEQNPTPVPQRRAAWRAGPCQSRLLLSKHSLHPPGPADFIERAARPRSTAASLVTQSEPDRL